MMASIPDDLDVRFDGKLRELGYESQPNSVLVYYSQGVCIDSCLCLHVLAVLSVVFGHNL